MSITVREGTTEDLRVVTDVLARAFYDDPVMTWLLPDDDKRMKALRRLYRRDMQYRHLTHGCVDIAYDDEQGLTGGVAAWDRPGRWRPSSWTALRSAPAALWALGRRSMAGSRFDEALSKVHPEEPHWYLESLGTDPTARGGGYGKAALGAGLDRADQDGLPAYLESSKEANIPFYERYGFAVLREVTIPDGPTLWTMWRKAR